MGVFLIFFTSAWVFIALQHGCSPVNLLHIFRTPFLKNTSEWLLLEHGESITGPKLIGDNFDIFFAHHSKKKLSKPCNDSFIITPCAEDKISKIIIVLQESEFNNNKATGINSISLKIYKLAKQHILIIFLNFQSLFISWYFFQKYSKMALNVNAQIIEQFRYYLMLIKSLKNVRKKE